MTTILIAILVYILIGCAFGILAIDDPAVMAGAIGLVIFWPILLLALAAIVSKEALAKLIVFYREVFPKK